MDRHETGASVRVHVTGTVRPEVLERTIQTLTERYQIHGAALPDGAEAVLVSGMSAAKLVQHLAAMYGVLAEGLPVPPGGEAELPGGSGMEPCGQGAVDGVEWDALIAGADPVQLPTDRPRPTAPPVLAEHVIGRIAPEVAAGLHRLSEGDTAVALLAAFQALLHRYTGQEELLLLAEVPADQDAAVTLPVRADLSGRPTFTELLREASHSLGAAGNRRVGPPPSWLRERGPLFRAAFQMEQLPAAVTAAGATFRVVGYASPIEAVGLCLRVSAAEGELTLSLMYDPALFEQATAARMLTHLQAVLQGAAATPERPVTVLELLSEDERRLLLSEWNQTAAAYDRDRCFHQLVEEQARLRPEAPAVLLEDLCLTYRELNERSNRLARYLQGLGVGPETLVALCAERSPDLVVGFLAILKAGGVYMPLDPSYPRERLAFMLGDAAPPVVVTQEPLLGLLPVTGAKVVCLDRAPDAMQRLSAANLPAETGPDSLAYVIYTSGSTGRPKGAMLAHRGLCNVVAAQRVLFGLAPGSRVLQFAPAGFDASVFELAMALGAGGTVCLADRESLLPGPALAALLNRLAINAVTLTPSALSNLPAEAYPALHTVTVAGEECPAELAARWSEGRRFFNLYGPTETTIWATAAACNGRTRPPIGLPIANVQAYILDRELQPVPFGVAGELCIGGVGVARAYLNRPELTAERFVPDPFGAAAGARLYRTGDLARRLSDGTIEFLGRIDEQVKIRGFRIELGEIESTLSLCPLVREAAVVAHESPSGDRRLVAYIVEEREGEADASVLRAYLRERLPEYMVPAYFTVLSALPLTPNGKIDRRALPAPDLSRRQPSAAGESPVTETERTLAALWEEVLGVGAVGRHERFYDLGGHSLLLTRLLARVRESFGLSLSMQAFHTEPTVTGMARLLAEDRPSEVVVPPLRPHGGEPVISFAQQRLWLLDQLAPDDPVYNTPFALRISGPLDTGALTASLAELFRRHEVLRTSFTVRRGEPLPRVSAPAPVSLPIADLRHLGEAERQAELDRLTAAGAHRPFDLKSDPPVRLLLIRLGETEHRLCLFTHHIVMDAWSVHLFSMEIGALYEAFSAGLPSPLPDLPLQYTDYASWQRAWAASGGLARQLDYWKRQLAGADDVLELPTDLQRPDVQTYRGARVPVHLPAGLSEPMRAIGRREGTTLYMTLLAAFQALLYRYTGKQDLLVGTPVAGRTRVGLERLIGFFVNTLVLRSRPSGSLTFREWLAQVRETTLHAYDNQDLPFDLLVEELRLERDASRSPLVQVMFDFINTPLSPLSAGGLRLEPELLATDTAKFDLALVMQERDGELAGWLEYNSDLFTSATAERMAAHYGNLLASACANPDRRLSELELMGEEERRQLLCDWNRTEQPLPDRRSLHERFADWARLRPEALAAGFGDARITYGELEACSNRLARHLLDLGVRTEQAVGLLTDRSPAMLIGMLGALKAGAAYLPLDPANPGERLRYMVESAGAPVVLSQPDLAGMLDPVSDRLVCLDPDTGWGAASYSDAPLPSVVVAENLAYVIYTSGTTGQPKGVCCSHIGVVNLLADMDRRQPLGWEDRSAMWTSFGFDVSVYELFSALTTGGSVWPVPERVRSSGPDFAAWLEAERITSAYVPPFMLKDLLDRLRAYPGRSSLRRLLVGVEPIAAGLLEEIAAQVPGLHIINGYGPTEAHICATLWSLPERGVPEGKAPIGRPVQNNQIYLLDGDLQPVPAGVPGELCVGGLGVARGYLGRPDLTAERFIPDPFSRDGGRLYRTGDIVRLRPDGNLEFIGRKDLQVKLRGYRIELGEIEAVLLRHPSIREAVVIAREDQPGSKRLVAYCVAHSAGVADPAALRSFAKEQFPDYMVPSAVVMMESLPLTPNGKVDRRALPAPDRAAAPEEYAAPRTATELALAEIWAEVLGAAKPGVNEDFFELGGHSLLAARAIGHIRDRLGVDLSLRAFFEQPTIAGVAAKVEQAVNAGDDLPLVGLHGEGAAPLSFAQERLWFLESMQPGSPLYMIPAAVRLRGHLDLALLEHALGELIRRHEALRTIFTVIDGQERQVVLPPGGAALVEHDLRQAPQQQREELARAIIAAEMERPFNLQTGPLMRAFLLRLDEQEQILLITLHHIISDGWSVGVLFRELSALYRALGTGGALSLPPLPARLADFAVRQRRWLQSERAEAQLAYWKRQLQGAPTILELPGDRPRQSVRSIRGAMHRFALPAALTERLQALSRGEGATLFMALLGAFQALLGRYTGQEEILVGTPMAGRNLRHSEGMIGCFVNSLVIRGRLGGDPTFRTCLQQTRTAVLEAYEHQDYPFEKLVDELKVERSLAHTPLFQVMFVLQNAPGGPPEFPGVAADMLQLSGRTAKFDLTFFFEQGQDGLDGVIEFNTDLFDPGTVERMAGHYHTLLEGIAADPDRRLSQLPLLTVAEAAQVVTGWNQTAAPYPRASTVDQLFREQAGRQPDATAIICGERQITYAELDRQADRMAERLRRAGVGPEVAVGVCMERSPELIFALLGIARAGGAYVPLDPDYPPDRLAFMMEDTHLSVLVGQPELLVRLPEHGARLITVSGESSELAAGAAETAAPPGEPGPETLLYVMYTSGSTGRPKGVCVTHRNVVRLVKETNYARMDENEVFLQFAPVSFDASTFEIWGSLLNGGRLVIMPPGLPSLDDLAATLTTYGVTTLWLTAGLFHAMAEAHATVLGRLRQLLAGGDVLSVAHVRKVLEAGSGVTLINGYGPTECTTFACCCPIRDGSQLGDSVPIGRPIGHTQVYVVDRQMNPVPAGVPGELYIGGDGVARGYLNRPDLTAERFVPDPFGPEPGARLYRTGDLVRWLPDGQIEFLGRLDSQVKIRGFRIELGEIEATLNTHPQIEDSVVIAREDTPGDKRLVAYLIPREGERPTPAEIRAYVWERLPDYMVPSTCVTLTAFPLNPNGKVDRRMLPAPATEGGAEQAAEAPGTHLERLIARGWQEILQVSAVGVSQNFFDLGGNSLLAVRLHHWLVKELGPGVSVVDLFRCPTVAALARHLSQSGNAPAAAEPSDRAEKQREAMARMAAFRTRQGKVR